MGFRMEVRVMGRKAKPIDLIVLNGNKSKISKKEIEERRQNENSIRPKSENIFVPEWLSDIAKEEFNRQVKLLKEVKLITESDVMQLATYCDAYSDYVECTRIIHEEGLMTEHTNKAGETNRIPHPLLTKKKQLFEQMKTMAVEFGLTPSARARIAIPQEKEKDVSEEEQLFGDSL